MVRLHRIIPWVAVFLILALPACNSSLFGDITPPPGSELSAGDAGVPPAETALPTDHAAQSPFSGDDLPARSIVFSGKVQNHSSSRLPAGLQVKLQGYRDMENILTQTTPLMENARFEFLPVDAPEGQVFIVSIEYQGIVFTSGILDPSSSSADVRQVDLEIYENTASLDGVYIDLCHVFISPLSADRIRIVVYLLISNNTQKVIAADRGEAVLRFSLPEKAVNLQLNSSGSDTRYVLLENGFGDTSDILPGAQVNEILYSYELAYDGKMDLSFSFPVPEKTGLLIIPEGLKISAENITDAGERSSDGAPVHLYSFSSLSAGEPLEIQLSGRAKGVPGLSSPTALLLGAGVFIIVAALIFFWLRKHSVAEPERTSQPGEISTAETRTALLDAIIDLDREYKKGSLTESEYTRRREQLKESFKSIK